MTKPVTVTKVREMTMTAKEHLDYLIDYYKQGHKGNYSIEEANLLEEIDRIEDGIKELEYFMGDDDVEQIRLQRDIDNLFEKWDVKREELRQLRSKLRSKSEVDADKEAEIRKAENEERMAKKKAKDIELMKERAKNEEFKKLKAELVPDDLMESLKRLF